MKQRKVIAILAMILVLVLCVGVFAACNKEDDAKYKATTHTYKTYASSFATSWNVLNYETNDQSSMFSYSSSSFYEFDYARDENGDVIDGKFSVVPTMASDYPTDITAEIAAEEGNDYKFTAEDEGYAWYIPVRKGMKWDNGDEIKLSDWIYSMKEQLNPLFQNYRADGYYSGSTVIHNAENYLKQGQSGWFAAQELGAYGDNIEDWTAVDGLYFDATNVKALNYIFETTDMTSLSKYKSLFVSNGENVYDKLVAFAGDNRTPLTQDIFDTLKGLFSAGAPLADYWGWADSEIGYFTVANYTYPELDFSKVGLRAVDDGTRYGLILILDKAYADTDTHYVWAYDFGGNWLVKPDVYEACKVAPAEGSKLYTSTYGTSVATSPSYGPYKLTTYQTGKFYEFTKNENWFGYGIDELSKGFYETDRIQCTLIEEWDTAWMAFQKGELSAISIDVKIADTYKTSQRAYFTPDDYVNTLQIQSQAEALTDANDGNAKEILLNAKFRKALSLAIDRAEYAKQVTTSSLAGFGLFNSMHYYDVQNGGVYRDTDVAKRVICATYGVDVADYDSLDEAYAAVIGYNLTEAKALVAEAIQEEIDNGTIKDTDKLDIKMGGSVDSEAARRPYNFLKTAWSALFEGTQFAGSNFIFTYDGTHGDNYAKDFKAGQYEVLSAGWSGAAWDPFFFISAYIEDQYRYAVGWDPKTAMIDITIPGIGADGIQGTADDGTDFTAKMSAADLCNQLNKGNWTAARLDVEKRLIVLAALEKCVLESYYSVPVTYYFSAALRSYQIEAYTDTYNTFMGWGGVKYYHYNYNDGEWAKYVDQNNGTLNYK